MNVGERSLKVLTNWNSHIYENEAQKMSSLQCLIMEALKAQDKETRYACADDAYVTCINVKAI